MTRKQHTLTGTIKYHRGFFSRALCNKRTLVVSLPASYGREKTRRYPVIYMHDGQNIFDAATSYIGVEWGADEAAAALAAENPALEAIIVGVYNTKDRMDEYAPYRDEVRGGGKGRDYADFLVKEVKPFMDSTYRTLPGRESTAVAGSSLGGLISLFLILEYPEVFSKAGVLSPSLYWAGGELLPLSREKADPSVMKLWLSMGTEEDWVCGEDDPGEPLRGARRLRRILLSKGFRQNKTLFYHEEEGGAHNEAHWARLLPQVFRFLLS